MPRTPTKLTLSSGRTRADLIACIASLVDAFACLPFLVLQVNSANGGRLYIASFVDPITCIIGYWVIYRRLRGTSRSWPILAFLFWVEEGRGSRGVTPLTNNILSTRFTFFAKA